MMKVYLDSDVVISAMISNNGAAYFLINHTLVEKIISPSSKSEIEHVMQRLNIPQRKLEILLQTKVRVLSNRARKSKQVEFDRYAKDPRDEHIVAGALAAKVNFLITYNLKDYNIEKIKQDLDILVITPALFLQYLRSR